MKKADKTIHSSDFLVPICTRLLPGTRDTEMRRKAKNENNLFRSGSQAGVKATVELAYHKQCNGFFNGITREFQKALGGLGMWHSTLNDRVKVQPLLPFHLSANVHPGGNRWWLSVAFGKRLDWIGSLGGSPRD